MSVAHRIYQRLLRHNVKNVFMYSGGSIMPLVDQFYKGSIKYYINANEQCSGYSATGYAKSSNSTGVAITTSGPGLTNIVTAIHMLSRFYSISSFVGTSINFGYGY